MGAEGAQSFQGQNVINLAKNFKLSEPQYNLLSKGLSFISTSSISRDDRVQFQWDMQNYHRRLKLISYFKDREGGEILPFVASSGWTPPPDKIPIEVKMLIAKDLKAFRRHYKPVFENPNILPQEIKALRELRDIKHVVIKPADKGSAVVILSRDQYILEVERQLDDGNYYQKLDKPIYLETVGMVTKILDDLKKKKFINAKQRRYLIGQVEPRVRRFYILPKIHKDPRTWTVPFEIPPGRPIVSDCNSETYFTAEYLDFYLNPLSSKHPAYVRDTYHFIDIVKSLRISSEFFFFSMDVKNLYTNIPIEAGIKCVEDIFKKHPDPRRPDVELLKLLEINLTRNDFMFNGKYYLQVKGTAMGKKFAPAYANIFMANWEREVFLKCDKKPAYYLRYLDDIWGVWTGSMQEFQDFVQVLNAHDPSIQLTTEMNGQFIDFLDTTVFKGPEFALDSKLHIKVFFKVTDTHALLHRNSFHPQHTFRGIVKSQLLRFKRICTRGEDFWEAVGILFRSLRRRGYSRPFLKNCLRTFQNRRIGDHGSLIPLITTFSSVGKLLNHKFKSNFEEVLGHLDTFKNSKVISAYRRNRNLKDILVQAKLPSLCRVKSLILDSQFVKLRFVKSKKDNTIHKILQGFSSRSKNCVYIIFCSVCSIQYVGETKNSLSTRMVQHRYNVRNKKDTDTLLVKHFLEHGLLSMRMAGLQRNINWSDGERKLVERQWIFRLGTKKPFGLNIKYN